MDRTLSRRSLLRTSGVALALPLLESMSPALASGAAVPPKRMVFLCTSLGIHPASLWPQTRGEQYELTPYLSPLAAHRSDFTLFSGLQHQDQSGRQPHDSEMTFLTAARKPGMGGFRNSISVDQLAANAIGNVTRFPSITLGSMRTQSQSYTSGGIMIPAEFSPAKLFTQLFLEGNAEEVRLQQQKLADGRSILDELSSSARSLRQRTSTADSQLLDDYFESIRQTERNMIAQQGWLEKPKPQLDASVPVDIADPAELHAKISLFIDLIPLILQTDSSRIISLMVQDHFVVPKIDGVSGNHHNLSHHGQDPEKIQQLQKIELGIIESFGTLLGQLKSKSESGSNLLASTSVLFGSNLGNANSHEARNLPIFMAGGGFKHRGFVAMPEETPLCNLFVTMLQQSGLEVDTFAQSTGTISV